MIGVLGVLFLGVLDWRKSMFRVQLECYGTKRIKTGKALRFL